MVDFKSLKQKSKDQLGNILNQIDKLNTRSFTPDDRFFELQRGKDGNAFAVIRFLPPPPDEDTSFVRIFYNNFQGPGGWYIEENPSTIGNPDPVYDYKKNLPEGHPFKDLLKRKTKFISNIYVVKCPSNRELEGKVLLFKYGKKIFDKLQAALKPPVEDMPTLNPFDFGRVQTLT